MGEDALGLLREQDWLATRVQLVAAGVKIEAVRWRVGRQWAMPLPGVVLVGDGVLSARQRARAACLYAGPKALVAGASAAALLGVTRAEGDGSCHIVVPRSCAARQTRWLRVHRTSVEESRPRLLAGLPVCSAPRAVVDAARWARDDAEAEAIVIEACQRGLVTPERLARVLTRFGRAPGTARAWAALASAEEGAWSVPEARLADLIRGSRAVPTPWLNPRLQTSDGTRLVTPDLWFDDVALAVMVHSKAFHAVGRDWVATVEQDGELASHGVTVLGVAPAHLAADPAAVLARVERAYAAARAARRPRGVVATPR